MQKNVIQVISIFSTLFVLGILFIIIQVSHFGGLTGLSILDQRSDKYDVSLVTSFEDTEEIEVIVSVEDNDAISFNTFQHVGVTGTFSSGGFSATVTEAGVAELLNNPDVRYIEPVRLFETTLDDVVTIIASNTSNTLSLTNTTLTGAGETVCVIDTGIDFTHPDLSGKNRTACTLNCINQACVEDCSETDLNSHGTHVAGIVGANGTTTGVAPDVGLIGLKVFPGSSSSGATTTGIKNAIDWCVSNKNTYNISVITMSLGTQEVYQNYCDTQFPSFRTSIDAAVAADITVTVSSGNEGGGVPRNTTAISSPACIQNAIPVSATDKDDSFSDYGHYSNLVQLFAPGTSVSSTCLSGSYCTKSGTSMSAPAVAGSIAIINQYLDLSGDTLEPLEIEDALNASGLSITDGTNTFSRAHLYDTLLTIETITPDVTLDSPVDDIVSSPGNYTFSCNVSDWQLANTTLTLWNASGDLFAQQTMIYDDTTETANTTVTDLGFGTYNWNCIATDAQNNSGEAQNNFTINIGGISTTLIAPNDATYTNQTNQTFTCSAQSDPTYELTNLSLEVWNSTESLIHTQTVSVNGSSAQETFSYPFSTEDTYQWNCLATNNNSEQAYASANYTIGYDLTAPALYLLSPLEDSSYTEGQVITFTFNVTDTSPLTCTLLVNNATSINDTYTPDSETFSIEQSFSEGTYAWAINCEDYAGHSNISLEERSITITAAPEESSGGGGGGSGGSGGSSSSDDEEDTETEPETNETTIEEETAQFVITDESNNTDGSALPEEAETLTTEDSNQPQRVSLVGNVIAAFEDGNTGFLSILGIYAILVLIIVILLLSIIRKRFTGKTQEQHKLR